MAIAVCTLAPMLAWPGLVAMLWAGEPQAAAQAGTSEQIKGIVQEALTHAKEADRAGEQGNPDALLKHAEMALEKAKQAQRAGHNERLNEGVYALGEAIEHGRQNETVDAREHVMHAIMKLSQAAGLQIPEGLHPTSAGSAGRTVRGEVVVKGEVLQVEKGDFFAIKDASGKEVHLFVGPDLKRELKVGDVIEAQTDESGRVRALRSIGTDR
ncbi:small metal-binding protein SmbP [Candidatus Nitrospira bockiana]